MPRFTQGRPRGSSRVLSGRQYGPEEKRSRERHRLRCGSCFLDFGELRVEDLSNRRKRDETSFRGLVPTHCRMPGLAEKRSSQREGKAAMPDNGGSGNSQLRARVHGRTKKAKPSAKAVCSTRLRQQVSSKGRSGIVRSGVARMSRKIVCRAFPVPHVYSAFPGRSQITSGWSGRGPLR